MSSRVKGLLFLLFLASGFCGLLYQVVWMRMAFASFGVITPVLSVVISVFMFGLFVGSWAGGRWVGPLTARWKFSAIFLYGIAELLIGIGAFAVPQLFAAGERTLLPAGEANSYAYLSWSALIIAGAIFPWCVFMGTTFPLMTAFVKERDQSSETSFSFLYLANVIGAMLGTSLTALVLVELLGFAKTLWVAAGCNFAIGLFAIGMGWVFPRPVRQEPTIGLRAGVPGPLPAAGSVGSSIVATVLFVTGFTSMAMEVVWTRAFAVVLKTQVYSFALLLFVYLLATWVGSLIYRRHLTRQNVWPTARLIALLAIAALLPLMINDPRLKLRWIGALVSIFPFCGLLGYLTPKLIDEYSLGRPDRVGSSYAINILGCILGPLAASYLLLPTMSVKHVLLLLAVPYAALMFYFFSSSVGAQRVPRRGLFGVVTLVAFVGSFFLIKTHEDRGWGAVGGRALVRRDHTATVASLGEGMNKSLLVNGIGMTGLKVVTKVMAHLPLAELEQPPKSALIICFGMGTTWRSALSWGIDVTAVELVPSVKEAFPYYYADAKTLLAQPNAKIVIDDGRRFLRRTDETFDLITLDPPPPVEAAGSSLLYSDEFYQAAKLRLKPQGIMQQWIPEAEESTLRAVARTLLRAFPHVRMFPATYELHGTHFLASRQPIPRLTAEQLVAKMPPSARADLVEWRADGDAIGLLKSVLAHEVDPQIFAGEGTQRVTDDQPFNEYFLLRRMLTLGANPR